MVKWFVVGSLVTLAVWVATAEAAARLFYESCDHNPAGLRRAKRWQKWNTDLKETIERIERS